MMRGGWLHGPETGTRGPDAESVGDPKVVPKSEPQRVQPNEEQVLWTILAHDSYSPSADNSEVRCACGFVEWRVGAGWTEGPVAEGGQLDRLAHSRHAARAVLALFATQPTVAEVRAQSLRDYAASRYEAHLEDPSIPWPDQPSRMAQQYAMCAAELRAAADREAEGGAR